MNSPLTPRIIKALKLKRQELLEQADYVNSVLNEIAPKPKLKTRTAAQLKDAAMLEKMERGHLYTKEQLRKRTGLTHMSTSRVVNRLVETGQLEAQEVGGVSHYRLAVEEMRIIAGEGVVA